MANMKATLEHVCKFGTVKKVVLEQIFPGQVVEVNPEDLASWYTEYGYIRNPETQACMQLRGVRLEGDNMDPNIISYAGYNWRCTCDGKVIEINLYIGVSHVPGLRLVRV